MKCENIEWTPGPGMSSPTVLGPNAALVLVFGERMLLDDRALMINLEQYYPKALIVGCTSAAEVFADGAVNNKVVITAVSFERAWVVGAREFLSHDMNSYDAGSRLAKRFPKKNLKHVLILSVGLNINGSDLVRGVAEVLSTEVGISGGLAGDQGRFEDTFVICNGIVLHDAIVGVGFYGDIEVVASACGGWDCFGPEKVITRSSGNKLFELGGESALKVYKSYLGKYAEGLPASALMFPLFLHEKDASAGVVRTILSVDFEEDSMTFAGDLPQDSMVRFMRADPKALSQGARSAAQDCRDGHRGSVDLALVFSCIGRKIILGTRVSEEILAVRGVFGDATQISGLYTYGEFGPLCDQGPPVLHNQTMAITTFREILEGAYDVK